MGAVVGFGLVASGPAGVNWAGLGFIALSWVTSPVISGIISVVFFLIARHAILRRKNPARKALVFLPFFYAFTFFVRPVFQYRTTNNDSQIITFFILFKGTPGLEFTNVTYIQGLIIAAVAAAVAFVLATLIIVPMAYRYIRIGADNWLGLTWRGKFMAIFTCTDGIEKKSRRFCQYSW